MYRYSNGQSVPVLNLRKNPCALFQLLMFLVAVFAPREKDAIVQETLAKGTLPSIAKAYVQFTERMIEKYAG